MSRRPWWQRMFREDMRESERVLCDAQQAIRKLDEAIRKLDEKDRDDG